MKEVFKMWGLRIIAICLSAGLLVYSQRLNKKTIPHETKQQLETIWTVANDIINIVDDLKECDEIDMRDLKEMQARAVMIRLYARSISLQLRQF